jgi:hypothetical protein
MSLEKSMMLNIFSLKGKHTYQINKLKVIFYFKLEFKDY